MMDEIALRLLHATGEQLHGKPTREVMPCEVAEKAGISPFSREYDEALQYLLDHGYIETYPNVAPTSQELFRISNKGLEEILSNLNHSVPTSL